ISTELFASVQTSFPPMTCTPTLPFSLILAFLTKEIICIGIVKAESWAESYLHTGPCIVY
ncbi:hypothetical protein OFC56_33260, partial [Escherichia coli]|nr:hypothetical protein [Escherichia coli]